MYEVYVEHPIVGEILLTIINDLDELMHLPDDIDGCPVKYRYIE